MDLISTIQELLDHIFKIFLTLLFLMWAFNINLCYSFYATETYIMHFLEGIWFPNAPDLAGHKVNNVYFTHRCGSLWTAVGVWALKQLCSHLHKITNEPVFYMALAPYDFDAGQRHYLGNWKGWALKISTFLGSNCTRCCSCNFRAQKSLDFQGPPLPIAHVMSLHRIKIITACAI